MDKLLGKYEGYLQTYSCASYNAAIHATHIGCWAYTRRKWTKCLPKGIDDTNAKAAQALELVERIFATYKGFEDLSEKRTELFWSLLDEYWRFLESIDAPKGSNIYKAVQYSLNQRETLNNVILDERLELTNNRAERVVKPFVIGRKNLLFSNTDKGSDISARCYSIIESANFNNLNVFGYLTYLLTELPNLRTEPTSEQLDRFMPWANELLDYCKSKPPLKWAPKV